MRIRIGKLGKHLEEEFGRIRTGGSVGKESAALLIAWEAVLDADVRIGPSITRAGLEEILYLVCAQRKEELFMAMIRDCVDDHIWAVEESGRLGVIEPAHDTSPSPEVLIDPL